MFLALFFAAGWIKLGSISVEEMRSKHFSLIMTLKTHKEKTGHFPAKFSEMKQPVPEFDSSPFDGYEQCVSFPSYCTVDGKFSIGLKMGFGLYCWMDLEKGLDFKC